MYAIKYALRYEDPVSYFHYLRMSNKTPSAQGELRERTLHTQCARRDNTMHAVRAPWERHESTGNRQLERRMNAIELRRNATVAVKFPCYLTALWES